MNEMRLTMGKARQLVKRELGIGGTTLEKPPSMNGNRKFPWYRMQSGNLIIEIYTTIPQEGKIINLRLHLGDGLGSINRFFYADDLTEATEYTEAQYWNSLFDQVDEKTSDPAVYRLSRQSREACQKHFSNQEQ